MGSPATPGIAYQVVGNIQFIFSNVYIIKKNQKTVKIDEKMTLNRYGSWERAYGKLYWHQNKQGNDPYESAYCPPYPQDVFIPFGKKRSPLYGGCPSNNEKFLCALELTIFCKPGFPVILCSSKDVKNSPNQGNELSLSCWHSVCNRSEAKKNLSYFKNN